MSSAAWLPRAEFEVLVHEVWQDIDKMRSEDTTKDDVNLKIERLLKNNKPGIALKRFIDRQYLNSDSMITEETTHILRVESLQNGRRFNAVIDFEPIQYFPSGTVQKNHWPYKMIVDRNVPWSILNHLVDGRTWLDFKCRLKKTYKIVECYGL